MMEKWSFHRFFCLRGDQEKAQPLRSFLFHDYDLFLFYVNRFFKINKKNAMNAEKREVEVLIL